MVSKDDDISTRVAVIETRLDNIHTNFEHLENKNTTSYLSLCTKIEAIHTDMQRLQRFVNDKNEKLSDKIDLQWKQMNQSQQQMIERIHANEKWRWTVIGGLLALSYLFSKVNILDIFVDK